MAQVALTCNAKENSFTLRSRTWTCTDIAKLLGEDIQRPKELSFSCAVHSKGLTCTIQCVSEADFRQMKSELSRVLG